MKIIALYLPQYHAIKENDEWWGKGFTEWTSVKKGVKILPNQIQPRIPLDNNYYNLLDKNVMKWQVEIARTHGIYGFCVYHYWFNGHMLLEKPMESYLEDKTIDFPFYFCWANERWTRVWENDINPTVLIQHEYDDREDVDRHFYYWLDFFKDSRYMKANNKPILSIYNPIAIPISDLKYMLNRWNELAIKEGFSGMTFTYLSAESMHYMGEDYKRLFDYGVEYEPSYVDLLDQNPRKGRNHYKAARLIHKIVRKAPGLRVLSTYLKKAKSNTEQIDGVKIVKDYDEEWKRILSIKHNDYSRYIPGAFVDWDNTPRRGNKGKVVLGASPEKFKKYFAKLVERAKNLYKTDMIVVFAWNEWSEGGYLEPDEQWKYGYLEAIKSVLEEKGEFPK